MAFEQGAIANVLVAPDALGQERVAQWLARVLGEMPEDLGLNRRQLEVRVVVGRRMLAEVQPEAVQAQPLRGLAGGRSAGAARRRRARVRASSSCGWNGFVT